MNNKIKEQIINYCNELGLNTVGITKCRVFDELKENLTKRKEEKLANEFEEEDIDKRINPFIYKENGKSIISIAFPYLNENNLQSDISFSKYTRGLDYHIVVKSYLDKICEFIHNLGGEAISFVDNNCLPERYIAYLSGVGFIGKNNMIITKKYGSFVFLGEIITDLELEEDFPIEIKCENCNLCLKECPTGAICGNKNSNLCLSYITQKKEIEDKWLNKLNGRLFGCDSCQDICPYNKNVDYSNLPEFNGFDFMKEIDLQELCNLDNPTFKTKYKITSCGWRGKNVIQRNAIINAITLNKKIDICKDKITSPMVKNHYDRLLNLFKL